jgi:cobalamin synthase
LRFQRPIKQLRIWLSLTFAALFATDFLKSGSATALLGVVAGLAGVVYLLVKPPAEGEDDYQRRRRQGWAASAVAMAVLVLLIALGAPGESLLAFAGVLILIALGGALWSRITYRRQ